jgi:hypothetical protein
MWREPQSGRMTFTADVFVWNLIGRRMDSRSDPLPAEFPLTNIYIHDGRNGNNKTDGDCL